MQRGTFELENSYVRKRGYEAREIIDDLNDPSAWLKMSVARFIYTGNMNQTGFYGDLKVRAGQINNTKGQVIFVLYKYGPITSYGSLRYSTVTPVKGFTECVFRDLDYGTYAIYVLHDENKNNRTDWKGGRLVEGVGLLSNPGPRLIYDFERMKFEFTEQNDSIEIQMIYP